LNARHINRFPHEFSGGQRQRIGIARALASDPLFIVCDEPISALDVSIQAQVVNLLEKLQDQLSLTYLFVAHDLSMVRHICDRVAVMYAGQIVETAATDQLLNNPLHPYTRGLLASLPENALPGQPLSAIPGQPPRLDKPIIGCPFKDRCPDVKPICSKQMPAEQDMGAGHLVKCWNYLI